MEAIEDSNIYILWFLNKILPKNRDAWIKIITGPLGKSRK